MTVYYNEIDPAAAAMLRGLIAAGHIAPGIVDERSIEDVRPDELAGYTQCHFFAGIGIWSLALRQAGIPDDYPIWSMSCPCQPFSAAGKGEGFADERHLWPAAYHLISQCRPERIVGEQVASKDTDPWFDLVQIDLEALGYAFGICPFPASGVGAPHIRDRAYWCAGVTQGDSSSTGLERFSRRHSAARGWQGEVRPVATAGESGGLANTPSNGFIGGWPRRAIEKGRQAQPSITGQLPDGLEGRDIDGGLANSDSELRDGCGECGQGRRTEHSIGCATCRLANDLMQQRQDGQPRVSGGDAQSGRQQGAAAAARLCGNDRPGPVNGFWRDADWLHCRDGKWRPAQPTHVEMVDGNPEVLGRMRAGLSGLGSVAEIYEGSLKNDELQSLSERVGAQTLWPTPGGQHGISEAGVLQPCLHVEFHGGADQSSQSEEFIPAIKQSGSEGLRDVQCVKQETSCASQGRKPDEQRAVKFDDVVRLLPSSLSFAELSGDNWTAQGLRVLRSAFGEDWALCDTPDSIEAVWASFSEEKKNRFRVGFDAARWEIVAPFPLASALPRSMGAMPPELRGLAELAGLSGDSLKRAKQYRVQQLKGYGNAINAQAATAFIQAAFSDKTTHSPINPGASSYK